MALSADDVKAIVREAIREAKLATHADIVTVIRGTEDGSHPENLVNIYNAVKPPEESV